MYCNALPLRCIELNCSARLEMEEPLRAKPSVVPGTGTKHGARDAALMSRVDCFTLAALPQQIDACNACNGCASCNACKGTNG